MKNFLKQLASDKRRWIFTLVPGLVFTALFFQGRALDAKGSVDFLRQLDGILSITYYDKEDEDDGSQFDA